MLVRANFCLACDVGVGVVVVLDTGCLSEQTSVWACDFACYPQDCYNRMLDLFHSDGDYRGFELYSQPPSSIGIGEGGRIELGVKSVRDRSSGLPSYHGMECDYTIEVPVSVKAKGNNAVYFEWDANVDHNLSRYVKTTNRVNQVGGNGNEGERFEVHWCDFIPEHEAPSELHSVDYETDAAVNGYECRGNEPAFGGHQGHDFTARLDDGALVTYRWYKH